MSEPSLNELCRWSAVQMALAVRDRSISATELVQSQLHRIEVANPTLNAFVTILPDEALDRAQSIDQAVNAGLALGPLAGVPFTVKDSIDTASVLTQRGSRLFAGRVPGRDASAVARLIAAGGILLAKTNLPEFSRWWETDNDLTGLTRNPWNPERTSGGSSGGEAAAIASGMSPLGIGTDVGISVRGPAHFTGIVGFKPTHGSVPLTGHFPEAPNRMWHIGPMARSVGDAALAFRLMRGPDGVDGYATVPSGVTDSFGGDDCGRIRVGWITDEVFGPIDPEVRAAVRSPASALHAAGCIVEEVRIPILEEFDCVAASAPFFAETLRPLKAIACGRQDELSAVAKRQLARPAATFDEHVEAETTVERLRSAFGNFFGRHDVLLCPVVTFPAPTPGKDSYLVDGIAVATNQMMRLRSRSI